jgi:hypothetical protein
VLTFWLEKTQRLEGFPEQVQIRVTPAAATFEDLHRVWSVFPQSTYSLSALFEAGPVFLVERSPRIKPETVKEPRVEVSLKVPQKGKT